MKKYSGNFLGEVARFERWSTSQRRSDRGLRQFYEHESRGIKPIDPDPYFVDLLNGKKWWEWHLNQVADTYLKPYDWHGWVSIRLDYFDDNSGFRQIRDRIGQKWSMDQVDWLTVEAEATKLKLEMLLETA